ncbi:MAG TPA: flagellar hook-associated protein FlgK, partial [Lachnospiraceae bacterium]|nr:flagellar hook-associated protein FlgK [Lachnospiraceae bacterium]
MSLFGDLYVGTSGLQSSQEALNVVAHNVTNTDTTGYVRQQVSYSTREYNTLSIDATGVSRKQTGLGVFISEVRQVRDRFVDQSYREESGRKGFYDISYGTVEEIEAILGELDGATFSDSMNDFWTAIEELVKDPSSEVCQSMLVQYAQSFSEAAQNVYSDMSNYQDKLNLKVKNGVDQINSMAHQIYQLNNQIRSIEAGGVENANDLKDERNLLLDQLSTLGKISYNEDFFGNILVKFEGHDLILGDRVNEMAYQATEDEGFYQVYWPDSAKSFIDA